MIGVEAMSEMSRRELFSRAIGGVMTVALLVPFCDVAQAQGKGGGNGKGGGKGEGNTNGGGSDGRGGGGSGKGSKGGSSAASPSSVPPSSTTTSGDLSVVHRNGMREMIRNGRYEMRDAQGRRIVNRPATGADYSRLNSKL